MELREGEGDKVDWIWSWHSRSSAGAEVAQQGGEQIEA